MSARQSVAALRRAVEQLSLAHAAYSREGVAPGPARRDLQALARIMDEVERIAERVAERAQQEAAAEKAVEGARCEAGK